MSNEHDRTGLTAAKGIAGFVVAVIVINVLTRVLPLPDIDLPSITFPDLPAWFQTLLHVKNWIIGAIVLAFIVGIALDQIGKGRTPAETAEDER